MEDLAGIGKLDRARLAALIRGTKGTVTVAQAAEVLSESQTNAAKMLSRWHKKGWMSRVRRGLYIPVSLEATTSDVPLEDSWIIAASLYSPCYISGWSAAEYWDLTEQIFRTTVVMTQQTPRERNPVIKGLSFLLCTINEKKIFGLKSVWRGQVKISVADPTRTILDMLVEPRLGGGIRSVQDMLANYLRSESKDLELLISYADQLGNGSVFKRLGFLLEQNATEETVAIQKCAKRLTKGTAKIDPRLNAERLVSRWQLWIPKNWSKEWA